MYEHVNLLLFPEFETLDAFGPVEVFGCVDRYQIRCFSMKGGPVRSAQGVSVETAARQEMREGGILLVPGGQGTRRLAEDAEFLRTLRTAAERAEWRLSVCTGSALLAAAGLLDGRRATSNKRAFEWVTSVNSAVRWVPRARWVRDGTFYTSSGVSAGIDMALGFVADRLGVATAEQVAGEIEYLWNRDRDRDPFAGE